MKSYFSIQQKRFGRLLKSLGIHPFFVLILTCIGFIGITDLLFENTIYAKFIYPVIGIGLILTLVKSERIGFLKLCFSQKDYLKIRLIENLLIITPFFIGLIIYQEFLIAFVYLVIGVLMSFIQINAKINLILPTPFYKHPFEFIIGFRKTFFVFFGLYVLTYISISVENYSIGLFAFGVQFLVFTGYYLNKSEPEIYVWIHSLSPKSFINRKIKTAVFQSALFALPVLITLLIFNFDYLWISLTILILGELYLITAVLFKYAFYPTLSIVQEMGFVICLLSPPILPIVIPLLYVKAQRNLNTILI